MLARPVRAAVRLMARMRLQRVLECAARIEVHPGESRAGRRLGDAPPSGDDPEAVHDFRVALRRLRSWLRAFRPHLEDTVARKTERALGRVSRIAGEARDLEVQREWLLAAAADPKANMSAAAAWLAPGLASSESGIVHRLGLEVVKTVPKVAARLARQLGQYTAEIDVDQGEVGPRMSVVMADRILEDLSAVRRCLNRVQRPSQVGESHLARIAMKRLRYLLEALDPALTPAALAVQRLALMQQALGDLHDAQVLAGRLARPGAKVPSKMRLTRAPFDGHFARGLAAQAPTLQQMAALRSALRARMASGFYQAHRLSRSRETTAAFAGVTRLARQLRRPPRPGRSGPASRSPARR